jgi:hypothetical protein
MNPHLLLIPVFVICVIGSMLSYTDAFRRAWWYSPLFVTLGAATTYLFAWGAKLLDNKEKVYIFSLYYDSAMMVAYYLLPLLIFSTRPTTGVLVGTSLVVIVIGLFIVKVYG